MSASGPEALPPEAEGLLASDEFVAERNRLAKELRAADRGEEAAAVARLRKPPKVVAVVNRAARAVPLHAQAATAAAEKLAEAQAAGDLRAANEALGRLGKAVDGLTQRAARDGGDRVAVATLIRAALTSEAGRRRLATGQLTEAPEPTGFEAFAGLTVAARRSGVPSARGSSAAGKPRERAAARREKLELSEAEAALRLAEDDLRTAKREEATARRAREAAQRRVDTSRDRVERARERPS
jgi:hypothetical protein